RSMMFSPWITPMVAMSIVWAWIYEPDVGLLNQILGWFHLPQPDWFTVLIVLYGLLLLLQYGKTLAGRCYSIRMHCKRFLKIYMKLVVLKDLLGGKECVRLLFH